MANDSRNLILKIEAPGQISVDMLSSKLQAAQQVLLNIGSALVGGGRRGSYSTEVIQSCKLFFVESKPGCLEVATCLPKVSKLFNDVGKESLEYFDKTLQALRKNDRAKIEDLYKDSGSRVRVIKSISRLLPEEDSEYDISITTNGSANKLYAKLRESLESLIIPPDELQEQITKTLTGQLFLIEVSTGNRQIGLTVNNRQITCFYTPEEEPIIRDLIPGTLVEVKGRATLNRKGDVEKIEEIIDISMVQPIVPLNWSRIDYGNKRFLLKEQIQIRQDFRSGVWVCEFEPLGIIGYGNSRHDALTSFRMDFAECWDNIAQEDDKNLTLDAQKLKKKLQHLVQKEELLE